VEKPKNITAFIGAGRSEIYTEYINRISRRAIAETNAWNALAGSPTFDEFRAIRLVELTEALHPRHDVIGGPVDAVEIRRNGQIVWIKRKSNCPAN
jgi:hypothetical protein